MPEEQLEETTEETPEIFDEEPSEEPEPEQEEESAAEPAEEDAEVAFDPQLLERAREYGLDPEHFRDPVSLERTLSALDKRPEVYLGKKQTKQEQEETPPAESQAFKLELDKDLYDEGLVEQLEKMHAHYEGRIKYLTSAMQQLVGVAAKHLGQQWEQQFDTWIEGLGDGFAPTFGKGRGRDLDRNSTEFRNRVKILEEMDAVARGYQQAGRTVEDQELFRRAVRSIFGEQADARARKQIKATLQKRNGQQLSRATGGKQRKVQDRQQGAKDFVREFFAAKGKEDDKGEFGDEL